MSFSEVTALGYTTFSHIEPAFKHRGRNQPTETLQPGMFVMPCRDRIAARCQRRLLVIGVTVLHLICGINDVTVIPILCRVLAALIRSMFTYVGTLKLHDLKFKIYLWQATWCSGTLPTLPILIKCFQINRPIYELSNILMISTKSLSYFVP